MAAMTEKNLLNVDWSTIPAPVDDGATSHLAGAAVAGVALPATDGTTVSLAARVSTGQTGGRVEIQVDRFDPLQGWVFYKLFEVPVSGGSAVQAWRPPSVGRWRARASFLGTSTASPSGSGYSFLLVARPLGTP